MPISAKQIAEFVGAELHGPNIEVAAARDLDHVAPHSVVFLHRANAVALARINSTPDVMAVVTESVGANIEGTHVVVKNARLAFARVLARFFKSPPKAARIAKTAVIGRNVELGKDISIGEYSVIEDNVRIGARTRIRHHVVIAEGSILGSDCVIGSHCVIGEDGFGAVHDENNIPFRFPHIGHTEIGSNVELGNFCAVPRGALDRTVVGEGTKTADFVQIPHNAQVGRYCLMAAYAKVGSGAVLEDHVFMGVRSSTRENVHVGKWAMIGQGAVVLKDVPERAVMAGVPARYLRDRGDEGGF